MCRWFHGQKDRNRGPAARAAGIGPYADGATVLINDLFADPQAQSGAQRTFGGEERLEKLAGRRPYLISELSFAKI
jgi:hypothetical protein